MNDESMSGLERAVWWIEYVIRNKGATHFRNRVVDMSWYEFLSLDVYAFIIFISLAVCYIAYRILRCVIFLIRLPGLGKLKTL